MGKVDGKVAIVTGAGRGMGRAIAAGYLHEGASVVVTAAREQAELDWFSQQEWSQRVLGQLADITNAHSCEQVIAQGLQRFGKVYVLVNHSRRRNQHRHDSCQHPTGGARPSASAGDFGGACGFSGLGCLTLVNRATPDRHRGESLHSRGQGYRRRDWTIKKMLLSSKLAPYFLSVSRESVSKQYPILYAVWILTPGWTAMLC